MVSRLSSLLVVAVILLAGGAVILLAGGCERRRPVPLAPGSGVVIALASLPAETRVILQVDVRRLAASPVVRRAVQHVLRRDPPLAEHLSRLLARCKLDPARDLETLIVGMDDRGDVALLARGRLDEPALVACLSAEPVGGARAPGAPGGGAGPTYTATSEGQTVWLRFGAERTAALATSERWLAKVADDQSPKIGARPELMALVRRVAPDVAAWGVGFVPPSTGKRLVELTRGEIAAAPASLTAELRIDAGLGVALKLDLASEADARALVRFTSEQLGWGALVAQPFGLAPLVSKARVTAEGKVVVLSVSLSEADLAGLEAALESPARAAAVPNDD